MDMCCTYSGECNASARCCQGRLGLPVEQEATMTTAEVIPHSLLHTVTVQLATQLASLHTEKTCRQFERCAITEELTVLLL
jgi:hypothetical protein